MAINNDPTMPPSDDAYLADIPSRDACAWARADLRSRAAAIEDHRDRVAFGKFCDEVDQFARIIDEMTAPEEK